MDLLLKKKRKNPSFRQAVIKKDFEYILKYIKIILYKLNIVFMKFFGILSLAFCLFFASCKIGEEKKDDTGENVDINEKEKVSKEQDEKVDEILGETEDEKVDEEKKDEKKIDSEEKKDEDKEDEDKGPKEISKESIKMDIQKRDPKVGDSIAIMKIKKYGEIKFIIFKEQVPEIAKNFITHSRKGFYDGLTFHRVIKGFMIQGGDPKGDGTGGYSYKGKGTKLKDEFSDDLKHIRGAVSMANSGKDTNGSQFFICEEEQSHLNGKHSVFGQVYEGINIVIEIANCKKDESGKCAEDVIIESIKIEEVK